ncbi:hypothetical protein QF046_002873 [Microbacterium sp. W4I4]|uniref:hypothetical protein n=1 Tax=Microbacterium sp. W4I4 TaxID=3042295 RepID=UPI00278099CA|nr:hypothetical protein [Microbacterium sp. W4I4]MDQ0615232.1 hypothetical protein [Microbacterium sp. W4I4]
MTIHRSSFRGFLERALERVSESRRADGYTRLPDGEHPDLYGTAAAVGIRIALGDRPVGHEADELRRTVHSFAAPDGMFDDPTHGRIHRAATAVTTLMVLGESPSVPIPLQGLLHADAAAPFLAGLDWDEPWLTSHDAAGLLAIGLVCADDTDGARSRWIAEYLGWLDAHADDETGLWLRDRMGSLDEDPGLFGNMGCSFHMHFLYEWLGRGWPHPDRVVDAGMRLLQHGESVLPAEDDPVDAWGFRQLDWVYSVGRSARSGHRTSEVTSACTALADRAATALSSPDATDGDLHAVQARVGLVAELATRLPDSIDTGAFSLRSIVDVRPFI